MRRVALLASLASLSLLPSVAEACTLAAPAYAFSGGAPQRDAPLNSPIYVDLAHDFDRPGTTPVLELKEVASGASVALNDWYSHDVNYGERSVLSFVPQEPLAPNTRYRVTLDLTNGGEPTTWEFSTIDELIPSMRTTGELALTHEEGRVPHLVCDQCGRCEAEGEDWVTKVRVALPTIIGGAREYGLKAQVVVTNDVPYTTVAQPPEVSVSTVVDITTTDFAELALPPLESGEAFHPCVSVTVRDGRNDTLLLEPQCFDSVTPVLEPIDEPSVPAGPTDEPPAKPGGSSAAPDDDSGTSTSCTIGPSAGLGVGPAAFLLASLGALRLRRRPATRR